MYRVRRIYTAKSRADRSVEKLTLGTQDEAVDALQGEAVWHGQEVETTGHSPRFYAARRDSGVYPTTEEFYVAAPGLADDKARKAFETPTLADLLRPRPRAGGQKG